MPLVLYNSLTRRKEKFEPLDPERVGMYVCGPTVYDFAHIGNARAVVAFDLLYRVLRHEYGADHVRYVRNITDVEDKIIAAARASGEPIDALTRRTTEIFHEDMAALGNLAPDIEPRATQYIPQMIRMIERLIASGHAYAAEGHALFRVASYPRYGKLSRRSRADLIAGARVEVAPYKEDPGDFVLWKPSSADQPGWDSPWGRGRPGWHIECSAMSEQELGETFDIHGGGLDLIFPHHENEIAQSVCAHGGHPFARYWLHNGMLTVGGAKMAKSEGNFIIVRDALGQAPGEVIRLALLMTHYRDPLDWTEEKLREARQTIDRFYRALNAIPFERTSRDRVPTPEVGQALEDDLNTPLAISHLHDLSQAIYRAADPIERGRLQSALIASGRLMGLLRDEPVMWLRDGPERFVAQIRERIADRAQALREGRFEDAERIRARLADDLIIVADQSDGTTTWRWLVDVVEKAHSRDHTDAAVSNPRVDALVGEWTLARKERRLADADRIHAELAAEGIILDVKPDGTTTWARRTEVVERANAQDHVDAVVTNPRIDALVAARTQARHERRFADADRIRAELAAEGVILEDHPDRPTTWRRQ